MLGLQLKGRNGNEEVVVRRRKAFSFPYRSPISNLSSLDRNVKLKTVQVKELSGKENKII